MIRVGVIGYGYWGPNLVRNLAEIPTCQVAAVSELRKDRRDLVSSRYPAATVTADSSELIRDPRIDAILVATPLSAHYALALEALRRQACAGREAAGGHLGPGPQTPGGSRATPPGADGRPHLRLHERRGEHP